MRAAAHGENQLKSCAQRAHGSGACFMNGLPDQFAYYLRDLGRIIASVTHFGNDFLQALDPRNSLHPEPLKIAR